METRETYYRRADAGGAHKRKTLETDISKLAVAIAAELLIFLLWFHFPARERYELLVHVALPLCIVFPLLNYRYLIVVPFLAFLPDIPRAFGIGISHSLLSLPIIFLAAFLPFVRTPRAAIIAGYAAVAVVASHFIVDARKYTAIGNFVGYPWNDMVLWTLLLTLIGFLLLRLLRSTEATARTANR